jgi:UDP-N-acetylmuramate: L-alanyl-gamma-D-glutamyl-meso-diaminopimelate ligase
MKMDIHGGLLLKALEQADRVFLLTSDGLEWDPESVLASLGPSLSVTWDVNSMLDVLLEDLQSGDCIVMMSNGSFQGLRDQLQEALKNQI